MRIGGNLPSEDWPGDEEDDRQSTGRDLMTGSGEAVPNEKVAVPIEEQDLQFLRDQTLIDPDYLDRFRPRKEGDALSGEFTLDDLDDFLGALAFEINHAEDSRRERRFEAIYDRLQKVERAHLKRGTSSGP